MSYPFGYYPDPLPEPLVGGGGKGDYKAAAAKGGNKRTTKAAAAAEQRVSAAAAHKAAAAAKRDAKDAARAAAIAEEAARANAPLMVDKPPEWLANSDGKARNAARDEFDSLHMLWHNTGLGVQRTLFELHHCANTPEERAKLIDRIRREVEAETEQKKAAQAGVAQRYREHNNDQQRLYVCACCGERNK